MQDINLELSDLVANREFREEESIITADYSPKVRHSEMFCELTRDKNPIHRKHPQYGEAISPGFLQTSAAIVLIREAMRQLDINPQDYPFSFTHSEMKSLVLTGFSYKFEGKLDNLKNGFLEYSIRLIDHRNNPVFELTGKNFKKEFGLLWPSLNFKDFVYSGVFNGEPLNFGYLVGSKSSESNLFALSSSSSIVFDALERGELPSVSEDLKAIYTSQRIYSDLSHSSDLKKGITLELYLSGKENFGKLSKRGENLDLNIFAKDSKERPIYLSNAPISFQPSRLIEIAMKRAYKKLQNS